MVTASLPPISEARYQRQILEAALIEGWTFRQFHWTSVHSPSGFPDLFLVHPVRDRALALEVKSEKGKLHGDQQAWLDVLDRVPGITARCVRPSDWDDVVRELRA